MTNIRSGKLTLLIAGLILGLCSLVPAPVSASPIVINGSFEANNWNPEANNLCGGAITGWNAFCSNSNTFYLHGVNNVASYGDTPYGSQYLVLGPTNIGGNFVEQTIAGFTAGGTYTLSFALSSECYIGNTGSCSSNPHASVLVSFPTGSATASSVFLAPSSISNWWDTWGMFSYTFVANASSVTIRFTDAGGINNGYDIGLDNVSVAEAVPEPSTLLLVGIGLVAVARRARRGSRRAAL
jgi:hypothetical protein